MGLPPFGPVARVEITDFLRGKRTLKEFRHWFASRRKDLDSIPTYPNMQGAMYWSSEAEKMSVTNLMNGIALVDAEFTSGHRTEADYRSKINELLEAEWTWRIARTGGKPHDHEAYPPHTRVAVNLSGMKADVLET